MHVVEFRRAWTPEDRRVALALACMGAGAKGIARAFRLTEAEAEDYFAEELAAGLLKANARVVSALLAAAEGGSVAAQVFWLKNRAGWAETQSAMASTLDEMAAEAPERAAELYERAARKLREGTNGLAKPT